jgi:hypothetical protein
MKKKMPFGFKHDLFSFAVMIMVAPMLKIQLFLSVFRKTGRNKIVVLHPPFSTLLEVGYMPLSPQPLRHGKGV